MHYWWSVATTSQVWWSLLLVCLSPERAACLLGVRLLGFSLVFALRGVRRCCDGDVSRSLSSKAAWRSSCCAVRKSHQRQNQLGQSQLLQGHKRKAAKSSVLDYPDDIWFKSPCLPSHPTHPTVGILLCSSHRSDRSYGSGFLVWEKIK